MGGRAVDHDFRRTGTLAPAMAAPVLSCGRVQRREWIPPAEPVPIGDMVGERQDVRRGEFVEIGVCGQAGRAALWGEEFDDDGTLGGGDDEQAFRLSYGGKSECARSMTGDHLRRLTARRLLSRIAAYPCPARSFRRYQWRSGIRRAEEGGNRSPPGALRAVRRHRRRQLAGSPVCGRAARSTAASPTD